MIVTCYSVSSVAEYVITAKEKLAGSDGQHFGHGRGGSGGLGGSTTGGIATFASHSISTFIPSMFLSFGNDVERFILVIVIEELGIEKDWFWINRMTVDGWWNR